MKLVMGDTKFRLNELIKKIRQKAGLSQEQLAQLLGKSKSTISRYESGEIDIPLSVLLKILETVNVPLEEIFSKSPNVKQVIYPYKEIPLYSVPASAGPGVFPDKVKIISMISIPRIDATFAVQVKGDSMEPVVKDGTVLLVNGNNVTPRDGEMIVCTYDSWVYVKWYHEENGKIYLISENPQYLPILVESDEYFKIHGVVVGSYNTEGFRKKFK